MKYQGIKWTTFWLISQQGLKINNLLNQIKIYVRLIRPALSSNNWHRFSFKNSPNWRQYSSFTGTYHLSSKKLIPQLWDTAGQERFRSLIPSYIRDSNVGIIVYNVTEEKSFAKIDNWIKDVKDQRGEDVIIFLVGNKTDLEGKRKVDISVAEKKAAEHNVHFIETSAKSGFNVNALFQRIARSITG